MHQVTRGPNLAAHRDKRGPACAPFLPSLCQRRLPWAPSAAPFGIYYPSSPLRAPLGALLRVSALSIIRRLRTVAAET